MGDDICPDYVNNVLSLDDPTFAPASGTARIETAKLMSFVHFTLVACTPDEASPHHGFARMSEGQP